MPENIVNECTQELDRNPTGSAREPSGLQEGFSEFVCQWKPCVVRETRSHDKERLNVEVRHGIIIIR